MSTGLTIAIILLIVIVVAIVVHSENEKITREENGGKDIKVEKSENNSVDIVGAVGVIEKIKARFTKVGYENLEKYENSRFN